MAKSVKKKDEELMKRIKQDPYTEYAVIECYENIIGYPLQHYSRTK